jgi:ABC-type nickel/cobalt efflux system permease component RcnA
MILLTETIIPQGLTLFSILTFGFLLGLRHSLEPDHIAAISTILNGGKNFWRASVTGCLWGAGHTLSLLVVGGIIILLKLNIAESLETPFELLVALTLILLGLNSLWHLYRTVKRREKEASEAHHHHHQSRSLIVGMVHGLAGSGSLIILISSTLPLPSVAFIFLIIFGIGSIAGMCLASLLITAPLYFTLFRFNLINYLLRGFAAAFSLAFGSRIILRLVSA